MPSRPPDDAPALLGLLLHRLASPIGAMANYVHVLPADELGCKEGLLDAVGDARATIDEARGWIEAVGTLARENPSTTTDLAPALEAAGERAARATEVTGAAVPPAGAAPTAIHWLLDTLLREGDAVFPAGAIRVHVDAPATDGGDHPEVQVTLAPTAARPGAPEMTDRLRLADALARRLGGRVEPVEDAAGTGAICLRVPSARPPTSPPSPPEASEPR